MPVDGPLVDSRKFLGFYADATLIGLPKQDKLVVCTPRKTRQKGAAQCLVLFMPAEGQETLGALSKCDADWVAFPRPTQREPRVP